MIEINDKIDFLLFELSNFSLDSSDITIWWNYYYRC